MTRFPRSYPVAALVALAALAPIGVLIVLGAGAAQWFDSHTLGILINTLLLTGFTVIGSVLLGVPLALLTAYVELPFRRLWLIALAAPLAMPSYIGAFTF